MKRAVSLLIALIGSFGAQAAQACTPVQPAPLSVRETRRADEDSARKASSPLLANAVAAARDIAIVHVVALDPAPIEDIPAAFRAHGLPRSVALRPVRYRFEVDRVLKGSPPQDMAFKPGGPVAKGFATDAWTIAPTGEAMSWSAPRSARDFWHSGVLSYGESEGGPGDCSWQWSFRSHQSYLVLRDAAGGFVAVEPLASQDPLPDLVSRLIADPTEPYPHRPTLQAYLQAQGALLRVRLTDCRRQKAKVLEVISSPRAPAGDVEEGEQLELHQATPSLRLGPCRVGAAYVLDGWPYSSRLHPIRAGVVTFDDRWMQLRFTGPKTLRLGDLRAIARRPG